MSIRVNDRTYEAMLGGAVLEHWPEDEPRPRVGARVVIFDRELDFTQHDVLEVAGDRVTVGPALPWRHV